MFAVSQESVYQRSSHRSGFLRYFLMAIKAVEKQLDVYLFGFGLSDFQFLSLSSSCPSQFDSESSAVLSLREYPP